MTTIKLPPVRDQIIEFLKTLPNDASLKDILYQLYIRNQIIEAQEEFKKGQFYSDEEARDLLKKRLQ